jgi:hypothetical protein
MLPALANRTASIVGSSALRPVHQLDATGDARQRGREAWREGLASTMLPAITSNTGDREVNTGRLNLVTPGSPSR